MKKKISFGKCGIYKRCGSRRKANRKDRRIITLDAIRKVRQKLGIKKRAGRGICGIDQA